MDDNKHDRDRQRLDRLVAEATREGINVASLLAQAIDAEVRVRAWRQENGVRDELALVRRLEDLFRPNGPFTPAGAALNSPTVRSILLDLWSDAERGARKTALGLSPVKRLDKIAEAFPRSKEARIAARQRKTRHNEMMLAEVKRLAAELQRLYHLKRCTTATLRRLDDLRFLTDDGYWAHFDPALLLDSVRRIREVTGAARPAFQRFAAAMLELDEERLERLKDDAKKRRKGGKG